MPYPPSWNEKNSIYITEAELCELVFASGKEEAKLFRKFIVKEVIPSLIHKGSYNLTIKVNLDTSFFESVYDKVRVVYIAVIDIFESGFLYEFGISNYIFLSLKSKYYLI
jgi:hypothetical protein